MLVWVSKWIQMKKLSTIKFHNFSRSTTFILVVSPFGVIYKIWISPCCVPYQGHMAKPDHLLCALIFCFAVSTHDTIFFLQFFYHSICSTISCLHNFVTTFTLPKWLNNLNFLLHIQNFLQSKPNSTVTLTQNLNDSFTNP